jgi:hypothetical protein
MKSVEEFAVKEIELLGKRRAAVEAIETAEQAAGIAVLDAADGESTSGTVERIIRAKSEVSAIDAAIRACRARRLEAIRTKRQTEAVTAREEAAKLHKQIEGIIGKVREHLAAIDALQESHFAPPPLEPAADLPLSQKLQMQLDAVERRAASLETEIPRDGRVDVNDCRNVEPLIEAMLRHEGDVPSTQSVVDWAAACEKHGRAPRLDGATDHLEFGELSRNFHLIWRHNSIDYSQSYTQVPSLVRSWPGQLDPRVTVCESGSDLFRCPEPSK